MAGQCNMTAMLFTSSCLRRGVNFVRAPLRLAALFVATSIAVHGAETPAPAENAAPVNPWLMQRDAYTEAEAAAKMVEMAENFSDAAGWAARAAIVQAGLRRGAGLETLPARTPLHPIIRPSREYDGYSVANVAFESLPGFFVTGNLYRPVAAGAGGAGARHPAILVAHGHGNPTAGVRPAAQYQTLCGTLARAGAVVLITDMVGYGEATQFPHQSDITLALQVWNGVRALDLLTSLPDVDAARLGMTGQSGGGTQTILLTALDERIRVSVPVTMVSAHFFGGCACESGMPIHRSPEHETNNVELAALAAPRAQLLVSVGGDWTKHTPEVEFPFLRRVYEIVGAGELVENAHFADEKHDYGPSKRNVAIRFLARHLGLALENVTTETGEIGESSITIEPAEALRVFDGEHPRPAHALAEPADVRAAFARR